MAVALIGAIAAGAAGGALGWHGWQKRLIPAQRRLRDVRDEHSIVAERLACRTSFFAESLKSHLASFIPGIGRVTLPLRDAIPMLGFQGTVRYREGYGIAATAIPETYVGKLFGGRYTALGLGFLTGAELGMPSRPEHFMLVEDISIKAMDDTVAAGRERSLAGGLRVYLDTIDTRNRLERERTALIEQEVSGYAMLWGAAAVGAGIPLLILASLIF